MHFHITTLLCPLYNTQDTSGEILSHFSLLKWLLEEILNSPPKERVIHLVVTNNILSYYEDFEGLLCAIEKHKLSPFKLTWSSLEISQQDKDMLLYYCVKYGSLEIARFLYSEGVHFESTDGIICGRQYSLSLPQVSRGHLQHQCTTLLEYATIECNYEMVKLLLEFEKNVNKEIALCIAIITKRCFFVSD